MENTNQQPITFHGDGSVTGNSLIQTGGKNKFLDNYNKMKKTDTEQLLQGIPEFIIKDMVLYFLFDNYPKKSSYITGMLETFINQLNLKHIKDVKIYDMIQWCKTAIEARAKGICAGYAFVDYCDTGVEKELGYLDLMEHVKKELPINEYIKGMTDEEMYKYLSESAFNYMINRISKNKFLFEQCEDYEALQATIDGLREGKDVEEDYINLKKKIERNRQKFYRLNLDNKAGKSALETGFTANLSEDECRDENQRNLQMQINGCNKFKFGHRWLNMITGGGLESKQLMVYGAPSGNGKTTMMISSAIDMALYNPQVKHEPGLTPCILYISAETGVEDIKGRYIKMLTGVDITWEDELTREKMRLSNEEIENELVEASRILSRHTPTKIRFIQVPNNSYSKNEIIRDIEILRESEKLQVVAVIADYLKGFKPVENHVENRIRIDNITSDLRALAIECDVAVITASQVKVEMSNEVFKARGKMETSVIPKDCPETVFSESKGVVECADFALVFAQTSETYERDVLSDAIKFTHLEALVIKSRAGRHNAARCFIPYVEGSQIAFQKDVDLLDAHGKPMWLTVKELDFKGDRSELDKKKQKVSNTSGLFSTNNKKKQTTVTPECNLNREGNVLDTLPESTFGNPALAGAIVA
jgi:replicative DNA helicase